MDHDIHIEYLNSHFFDSWADLSEHNLEKGYYKEENQDLVKKLISILREKARIEEKKEMRMARKNRPKIKKGEKLIQKRLRLKFKKTR
jgi:hypothetical protein